jgi:H+/Cl- antiporter ClcA
MGKVNADTGWRGCLPLVGLGAGGVLGTVAGGVGGYALSWVITEALGHGAHDYDYGRIVWVAGGALLGAIVSLVMGWMLGGGTKWY